jgi:antibiotic biosynthesis monooxygenase (ABM) superfamily enzyme
LTTGRQSAAASFAGRMGGLLIPPKRSEQGGYHLQFALDTGARTKSPPACWKLAFVTWPGIFSLVLPLSPTIGSFATPILWLAIVVLVVTVLVVTARTCGS